MSNWEIRQGHVLDVLAAMPAESVHCAVTSPPYWGLRAYKTEPQIWDRARDFCDHQWGAFHPGDPKGGSGLYNGRNGGGEGYARGEPRGQFCGICGAWRGELGSEPTIELYVEHIVAVFREVRRVLRKDGTCWVNVGDSYAGSGKGPGGAKQLTNVASGEGLSHSGLSECKPKDLCLIPFRLALALQADGWWVRSDIAWCKKAPMPESVQDRPTAAWEHIFLLTKSARYYYDAGAVREPSQESSIERMLRPWNGNEERGHPSGHDNISKYIGTEKAYKQALAGRNLWNYWTLAPERCTEAHFATYPTEIPRRAILASTSERGCCPMCGAPWRRVVEREFINHQRTLNRAKPLYEARGWEESGGLPGHHEVTTLGWEPTCKCPGMESTPEPLDRDIVPCTVLDPFVGSGTTILQALRLGRRAIGIELSEEYVTLARRRIIGDAPLWNSQ